MHSRVQPYHEPDVEAELKNERADAGDAVQEGLPPCLHQHHRSATEASQDKRHGGDPDQIGLMRTREKQLRHPWRLP